jgi:hypothetical protein
MKFYPESPARGLRVILLLLTAMLVGFLFTAPTQAATLVATPAQAESEMMAQTLQTVLLAVANSPASPAAKTQAISDLQYASLTTVQATTATTQYLVISASISETGSTAKVGGKLLTIPLAPVPAATLQIVFAALGSKDNTLSLTGTFTMPTVRINCLLFVIHTASKQYDVTASAAELTGAQVAALANSLNLSFKF